MTLLSANQNAYIFRANDKLLYHSLIFYKTVLAYLKTFVEYCEINLQRYVFIFSKVLISPARCFLNLCEQFSLLLSFGVCYKNLRSRNYKTFNKRCVAGVKWTCKYFSIRFEN